MSISLKEDEPLLLCSQCRRRINSKSHLVFDLEASIGFWHGKDLNLTAAEFRLLNALLEAHGGCVSWRKLYDVIKTPGFIAGEGDNGWKSNVRSMTRRMRDKFRKITPDFEAIRIRSARGYAWIEEP